MAPTKTIPIEQFVTALASKQPTPGGGAAAAIAAAIGNAAAAMAAAYTTRKKDIESGAAEKATELIKLLDHTSLLAAADEDAEAYVDLQRSWKDTEMSPEEKSTIEARALAIPTNLVEVCHANIVAIKNFLPHCNPMIKSDAKVGMHQLAGAARAAYQTVLVNTPSDEEKMRLQKLLKEIRDAEDDIL